MKAVTSIIFVIAACLISIPLLAQDISPEALVTALQEGGHVIVMRHASSPRQAPDAERANAGNANLERQLDANGRETAKTMGESLQRLGIPVEAVLSSPAYRSVETGREMGFGEVTLVAELSNEGIMAVNGAWLAENVTMGTDGGNRILITHGPNIRSAFPEAATGMDEGESWIFRPSDNGAELLGRLKIESWNNL